MKVIDKLILGYLDQSLSNEELVALSSWIEASSKNAEYFTYWAVQDHHTRVLLDWRKRANAVESGAETVDPIDQAIIHDETYQDIIQEAIVRRRQEDIRRQAEEILKEDGPSEPEPSSLLFRPEPDRKEKLVIVIPRALVYAAAIILIGVITVFALNLSNELEVASKTPDETEPVPAIPTYGLVTNAMDPVWADASPKRLAIGDSLLAGRYMLAEGGLEFKLDLGATVLVEAPTTFDIIDKNTIYLDTGRCVATAPPSAQGFTVRTASADFVDIGTQFGVSVVEEDATEAHVFTGIVDAYLPSEQNKEQAQPIRLTEHTAVRSEADSGQFQKIDAEPPRFGKSLKELMERPRTSGQVFALYSPAEDLDYDRRRDGNIEVFRERIGVKLLKDVEVSFLGTGLLQNFVTPEPPTLSAGTTVDSYFIHYNVPRDQLEAGIRAKGVVYFDQPIVALIYNNKLIYNSNIILGAVGTDYGTVPADVSGTEGFDYPHGARAFRDEIEVAKNRMSIRMSFQLGDRAIGGDNIRVLTKSSAATLSVEPGKAIDTTEQADLDDVSQEALD